MSESQLLEDRLLPYGANQTSSRYKFIGCNSDDPDLGSGYPCALWQLFHLLSVEHAHRWKWNRLRRVRIES